MDSITSQLSIFSLSGTPSSVNIAYLIGKKGDLACYFHPSSDKFMMARCVSVPDTFEVGQLYNFKKIIHGNVIITEVTECVKKSYVQRGGYAFEDSGYEDLILPSLLLGSRFRDYDQSCATVIQRDSPLILSSSSRPVFITKIGFHTESGESVNVMAENVNRNPDLKTIKIYGEPIGTLPASIVKGSRLQFCTVTERIPLVTKALELFYSGTRLILRRTLLDRIYGKSGSFTYQPMDRRLVSVEKDGGTVVLNGEQSEAVHRYNSDCPAFAVESPPGTGKTMTAAAMAVSYCGRGLQLFLSTANVPVFNMAIALSSINYGEKKIVHLISADREASGEKSPFSIFEGDDEENEAALRFKELGEEMENASKSKQRRLKMKMRAVHADALAKSGEEKYDIILATVDMILGKLLKPKNKKHPCPIQSQLETDVRRVVIDEASQLTEAALNAIVLCFPLAQIVLIGDSKQLPPFKYEKGEMVSEMAAHSALVVLSRKKNVPVINMRMTYRQAPSAMVHYSDVFYGGRLSSGKPEQRLILPSIFGHVTKDLMFLRIDNSKTGHSGTSLINDAEIAVLGGIVTKLRMKGYDQKSVMIIAYYDAQRKLASASLPEGYEVLTVDSAQGREKDIVIVLTTRDSPTTTPFFTCPLRCNVAVSRHKRALIILGHPALLQTEPWKELLTNEKKYFSAVSIDMGSR